MDTSDPEISFDREGFCNHCNNALRMSGQLWMPGEEGTKKLHELTEKIREEEKGKDYDCIIGLSGGVDSSYLAYFTKKVLGLRPLVVHVDCGWNSELAVQNIENLTRHLDIELHTFVVNWEEMKDLQRSFFKASLMDQDIPQDHAIFAALYRFADDNNIRYAFNGGNFSSEIIIPSNWGYQAMDLRHLKDVHRHFGELKLTDYPVIGFFRRYIYFNLIRKLQIISPLNLINYNKEEAINLMTREFGWKYYGGKHHESRFTKFYQNYYLPHKFGFDKRRAHLSSLIVSGQMTRAEALTIMEQNLYEKDSLQEDLEYVAKKLDWTPEEFMRIIEQPPRDHKDFSNNELLFRTGLRLKRFLGGLLQQSRS